MSVTADLEQQTNGELTAPGDALDRFFPLARPQKAHGRILVVEDDGEMRSLLEDILAEEGYRATGAPDPLSALMILLGEGADLLVTDWKMPAMDGLDLVASVRRCLPGLPVVFVTAYASSDLRTRAIERGVFSILPKPFHRHELLAHVEAALASETGRGRRRGRREP